MSITDAERPTGPAGTGQSEIAREPGSDADSVLAEINELRRRRRGRHRTPPWWLLFLVRCVHRVGHFVRHVLPRTVRNRRSEAATFFVSLALHVLLAMLLAAWMLPSESSEYIYAILMRRAPDAAELNPKEVETLLKPTQLMDEDTDSNLQQIASQLEKGVAFDSVTELRAEEFRLPIEDLKQFDSIPVQQGELGRRSAAGRQEALVKFGGTAQSEKAVMSGLRWLQSIQRKDGSWNFAEIGGVDGAGLYRTTEVGATSLAMLCFLGAGHTHESDGPFQNTMSKAMTWLMKTADTGSYGADLRGNYQGNSGMYVQGLATIVVCEAAAMEPDDRALRRLAIDAVAFIERAQDPFGGGWRYQPRERGDTSVTGWQLMALQSAKAGRIRVDDRSFRDARDFLTTVESGGGAFYGYRRPEVDRHSMTAVGLLCRMYLGWKRNHDGLRRGVERLSEVGPSREDMYYNYYATQVMHHWGGEEWTKWNERMREQLIETQVTDGPAAGSWNVTDPHGDAGGRIYQTALCTLTLEVYYRHLPLYRRLEHLPEEEPQTANTAPDQ